MDVLKISFIGFALLTAGCATIPGKTRSEQIQTTDHLVERTLADLAKQTPKTKEEIAQSVGYVVMDNKITKIPVVGAGGGYGVAIDNKTKEKTYLRMSRFDIGGGWGARSLRPVLIFQNEDKFRRFIKGIIKLNGGAEASAKVGDMGAAGGAGSGGVPSDNKGYSIYFITDAGVSATMTVGIIRVKPVKLKK